MSNYLAIATVTAALQQLLLQAVTLAVPNANVGFRRPDGKENNKDARVNIYLYRVTPNAAYRNADLPTRRGDGSLVHKPLTALDLHYLLTFHGVEEQLEPQRMLGAVVSKMQSQPLLSTQNIQQAEANFSFLEPSSGLENQVERIRFTPASLSLEEFSKLWSAFFQVEYSLAVVYQASVVLIESPDDMAQTALPVQMRTIQAAPFAQPVITRVTSSAGEGQPILPTSQLVIQGTDLLGELTTVRIGNSVVTPAHVTQTTIKMPVPTGLPAGILGLQVIQQLQLGVPPTPHPGYESNVAAIVLQPVIVPQPSTGTQVVVNISPAVQPGQNVTLLLNRTTAAAPAPPAAFIFTLPALTVAASTLTFNISKVPGGGAVYFVRVKVDGAESPLNLNPGAPLGPTVTIP